MPEWSPALAAARLIAVVGSAMALVACPDGDDAPVPLAVGHTIADIGVSGSRPALVWVFDAEACLGCDLTDPARSVRALQRQLGDRFETVVVAVSELGSQDRSMVGRFLEAQRISARVEVRTRTEHERDFGPAPIPAFYLLGRKGEVYSVLPAPLADERLVGRDSLTAAELIERLAEEGSVKEKEH